MIFGSMPTPRPDQQPEPVIEAVPHLGRGHRGHAGGGQFDRQRDSVKLAADLGGFLLSLLLDSRQIVSIWSSSNSPTISSSSDSIAGAFSPLIAKAAGFSGSLGPAIIESNTLSKGLVIPTSTDTAFFAASPLRPTRL